MNREQEQTLVYRLALAALNVDVQVAEQITGQIGSLEEFFCSPAVDLAQKTGFQSPLFDPKRRQDALEKARREVEFIVKHRINVHWFENEGAAVEAPPYSAYPALLRICPDAPAVLFSLGHTDLSIDTHALSIVGTRHATNYGVDFTSTLTTALAETLVRPPVIVSGLAYGIDVAAHRGALANKLPTVAVLAHGLNTIYPAPHRKEAARIISEGGMIVSEFFSQDKIHRSNFLQRNRLIAGLGHATIVVESDSHGGALATARIADTYGREVFAVPGRVTDRYSTGCNNLILRGVARMLTSASQLADELRWEQTAAKEPVQTTLFVDLTPTEQLVVDLITQQGDANLEEVKRATNATVAGVLNLLGEMEHKGIIAAMPSGRYRLL